jgi:vacuolar-type H+-ATPase subunit H
LAQETIDTIRAAEQAANQLEKDAETESQRILQEAQERARELSNEIIMESQNKAQVPNLQFPHILVWKPRLHVFL